MFLINDVLITPDEDHDTILRGITKRSVIEVAQKWGIQVEERMITVKEIIEAAKSEANYIENQIRLQIEGNEATNVMPSLYISKVEKPTTRSLNDF